MNANVINDIKKESLSKEARMQMNALKQISRWRMFAIAFSTIGVAITYAGMAGESHSMFLSILGIALIILSVGIAMMLNLGLRNGRRNVEKILNVLEENNYEV